MNALFLSCHASLEYYMCQIFQKLNIAIPYPDMDIFNPERPFISGYREPSEKRQICIKKHHERLWTKDDLTDIDFIYMMNLGNVVDVAKYYTQFDKKVIIHLFGQYNMEMVYNLFNLVVQNENLNIVCYSKTEYGIYDTLSHTTIRKRLFYIPFGLDTVEFSNWNGNILKVYTTCNDFFSRAIACSLDKYQQITTDIPAVLSGRNTEPIGGIGTVPFDVLKQNYRDYACYLSMGTIPAPYTLTPLEAMMSGCPTVIYDNGMGIANEEISSVGLVSSDITLIRDYIERTLTDRDFAVEQSKRVREIAIQLFSMDNIVEKWAEVLNV